MTNASPFGPAQKNIKNHYDSQCVKRHALKDALLHLAGAVMPHAAWHEFLMSGM
jgi:hypothetical protein